MAKTTSYYIFGNKLFYPSKTRANIKNQLSSADQRTANIYKPNSYSPYSFGTDFTNVRMSSDATRNPYSSLAFYYQLINQKY